MLGQVLGCDVREHLLGRRVVKGDLVLLDKLAHEEVPKGGAAGNGGPCSSPFSGSWLMLGEAGSGSLVPASRWSTATPGEAGVDDGDGD